MPTTRDEIRGWLDRAALKGATHMIVATDTFDWSDYPVFVLPGDDAAAEVERLHNAPMSKVMECYRLASPWDDQLAERRAFHTEA
jgi:hypothetical protein